MMWNAKLFEETKSKITKMAVSKAHLHSIKHISIRPRYYSCSELIGYFVNVKQLFLLLSYL